MVFTTVEPRLRSGDPRPLPPGNRHTLDRWGLTGRRALKRFLYAQLALRSALLIALGREQPLVRFTVESDPPSLYLVFGVRPGAATALADRVSLPPRFELTPLRCLSDDEPALLLTLNIYQVSGITNGRRAEWSVYVPDATGTPRYLIVDARSSTTSMDPVDVLTPASRVDHERRGSTIVSRVAEPPRAFSCTVELGDDFPQRPGNAVTAPEWTTANDDIYWGNGIADRTFYDAGLAAPRLTRVGGTHVELEDSTPWADYVEPEPRHVLVHHDPIEFVVAPWANLDQLAPPAN